MRCQLLSIATCAVVLIALGTIAQAEEPPMEEIGRVNTTLNGFPASISISTPGGRSLIDRSHTKLTVRRGKLSDPTRRYEAKVVGDRWIVTTPYAVRRAKKHFNVEDGVLVCSKKMGQPRYTLRSSLHRLGASMGRAGHRARTIFRATMSKTRNMFRRMTPGHRRVSASARPVRVRLAR
jgi:hypothetical protein